ncbi:hypothetical protein GQ457_01G023630 [Hibiscus cannabinus]
MLPPSYAAFVSNVSSTYEPSFFHQAVKFPVWRAAMDEELHAMESLQTWSIVPLPKGKQAIDCKWVYRIKHKADGTIDRYKALLVAKVFTQNEGVDYTATFSPMARMTSFKILLALVAAKQWHLLQLDVNNAFLNGVLDEEVYMKLPLGYKTNCSNSNSGLVYKLNESIYGLKQASRLWFSKPTVLPILCPHKLSLTENELLEDPSIYRRLVGQFLYLTHTRPDVTYVVHLLNQFKAHGLGLFFSSSSSLQFSAFVDSDYSSCLDTRRSTSGYCTYLGNSMISWRSKKHTIVSQSSCEAEYKAMASVTCELVWLATLLSSFQIVVPQVSLYYGHTGNTGVKPESPTPINNPKI